MLIITIKLFLLLHLLASPFRAFDLQEGVCKQKCDEKRQDGDNKALNFTCHGFYEDFDSCLTLCEKCPVQVCNEYEQTNYQFKFYCPSKEPGQSPPPDLPEKRTYKGKCKDRCEKSRAGGTYDFRLNCTSRYTTKQEEDLCLMDCNSKCGEDDCYKNNTISCKKDLREARRIEKEKKKLK